MSCCEIFRGKGKCGEIREGPESHFARSRRANERARRALSGRAGRNFFCRSENRRGRAAFVAAALGASDGIYLSALVAARAGALAAARGLLRARLAGDANSWASQNHRARESSRDSRPDSHRFEPHHAPRRHWAYSPGAADAFSSLDRTGDERRDAAKHAAAAARLVFRETLGVSAGLLAGDCAF